MAKRLHDEIGRDIATNVPVANPPFLSLNDSIHIYHHETVTWLGFVSFAFSLQKKIRNQGCHVGSVRPRYTAKINFFDNC